MLMAPAMPMLRNQPPTHHFRQRRSLLLGFAALVGGGVLMWKWETREPTFIAKLARLFVGTERPGDPSLHGPP